MNRFKALAASRKTAVIISYISIAVHTVSNLILTPLYLKFLGLDKYGLYQMIYTVASYILILDFGIKTAMVRYISKYHAVDDYESEKNFAAHCLIIVIATIAMMLITGSFINHCLLKIYPSITAEEADTAHKLFFIMLIVISATVMERFVAGCLASYERFTVNNTISVLKLLTKIVLTISFLYNGMGVLSIAIVDVIITGGSIAVLSLYAIKELHFKIKLTKFQFTLILELLSFMLPVLLQAIIGYINNYVDKTVLGIMTTKADVAIYSVAMTFITVFNSLPTAISGVFLPQATRLIFGGNCNSQRLTDFVVRPGRYQFMICGGFVCGFFLYGKEFISLWVGSDAILAWSIALIIMIPNMFPLIQNTAVSILDALKKRLFRSVVLFSISILNVIISIILVSKYGMIGAPIGTAMSFIIGYGLIMNIYYQKVIKLQVARMFKEIFSKTWLCLIPPIIVGIILNRCFSQYSWFTLISKGIVFIAIYGVLLMIYGFNEQEQRDFSVIIKRLKH